MDQSINKQDSKPIKLIKPIDECRKVCENSKHCQGINKSRNISHTYEKNCPFKRFLVRYLFN